MHMVPAIEKQLETAETVRVRVGSSSLSSQMDTCPVLHQPQKPPSFPR